MNTKLTLSLEKEVIEKAREYAKSNKQTLSKLVESFFKAITSEENDSMQISPTVKELSGIINLPSDFDETIVYKDHLSRKYK